MNSSFGRPSYAPPPPSSSALFGSSSPSRSSYAPVAYQAAQQQQQASLFGSSPSAGFGGARAPSLGNPFQQTNLRSAGPSTNRLARMDWSAPVESASAPTPEGNRSLQDYQMQLMLLEQQNKNRHVMARQQPDETPSNSPQRPQPPQFYTPPVPSYGAPPSFNHSQSTRTPFGATHSSFGAPAPTPASNAPPTTRILNRPSPSSFANFDFDSFLSTDSSSVQNPGAFAPTTAQQQHVPPVREEVHNFSTPEQLLQHLIALQSFEGSWMYSAALMQALGIQEDVVKREIADKKGEKWVMTVLVVAVFEERLGALKGSWDLVVEKARDWLAGALGEERVEELVEVAKGVVG